MSNPVNLEEESVAAISKSIQELKQTLVDVMYKEMKTKFNLDEDQINDLEVPDIGRDLNRLLSETIAKILAAFIFPLVNSAQKAGYKMVSTETPPPVALDKSVN